MLFNKLLVAVNDYNMKKWNRTIKIPFTKTCCYNEFVNVCDNYCKTCDYYGLCEQTIVPKCRVYIDEDCVECGDCL